MNVKIALNIAVILDLLWFIFILRLSHSLVDALISTSFGFIGIMFLLLSTIKPAVDYRKIIEPMRGKVVKMHIESRNGKIDQASNYSDVTIQHYSDVVYPIIEYEYNGERYEKLPLLPMANNEYEIGDIIDILVNPEQPDQILLHEYKDSGSLDLVLVLFGFIFSIAALVFIIPYTLY